MAAGMMGVALIVICLTFSAFSSCAVPRELLMMNSTSNESDANIASAEASFFLGNDTVTSAPSVPTSVGATWCVAKNNIDDKTLQEALDYACGLGGADCTQIQQGGICFDPDNVQSHASFAFNSYFMKNGMLAGACDFGGSAAPTTLNPSHGTCIYDTGSTTSTMNGTIPGSGGSVAGVPNTSTSIRGTALSLFMTPSIFIMISLVVVRLGERLH